MSATSMWVRSTTNRHRAATAFLAVTAGLAAAAVGFTVQAARRSDGSVTRFTAREQYWNAGISACPPGVEPQDTWEVNDFVANCINPATMNRFRQLLVAEPDVQATTRQMAAVVGVLDPRSPNGWGYQSLAYVSEDRDDPAASRAFVVAGRLPRPDAPDELAVSETTARELGIHVGAVLPIASWAQSALDDAGNATGAPTTPPVASRVVGIVRTMDDLQSGQEGTVAGTSLHGLIYVPGDWFAAHGSQLANYGTEVAVKLRSGASVEHFRATVGGGEWRGWTTLTSDIASGDPSSTRAVEHAIGKERSALLLVAAIGATAALAFCGLAALRQLRRELEADHVLRALGVTSRGSAGFAIARGVVIAVPATLVGLAVTVVASPFGPVGLARRTERSHPVRIDAVVLGGMIGLVALTFVAGGVLAAMATARAERRLRTVRRPQRFANAIRSLGPVPRSARSFVRGGGPGVAVGVGAVAVAIIVAACVLVASFDDVMASPRRYGSWWDVAIGQYAGAAALRQDIAAVRADPDVVSAAGYDEQTDALTLDGQPVLFLDLDPYVGAPSPVMLEGRPVRRDDEVVLGPKTARRLRARLGSVLRVDQPQRRPGAVIPATVTVVGVALVSDPVSALDGAGDGVYVTPRLARQLVTAVAQAIVIKVDPAHRDAAIRRLTRQFAGSARLNRPPLDVEQLRRLRSTPWGIAALVALLAGASLVHALVTMLARAHRDRAVLGVLGLTRSQLRRASLIAAVALGTAAAIIGVPLGIGVGRRVWLAISGSSDVDAAVILPWLRFATVAAALLLLAALLAMAVDRINAQRATEALRVE